MMASYVCTNCGKPAMYETDGYISSFCEECWKDLVRHNSVEPIDFKPYYKVTTYKDGKHYKKTISFEDEWNRYLADI